MLHSQEKENMSLSKNGVMSFRMKRIHNSTYLRLRKVVGMMGDESAGIIE